MLTNSAFVKVTFTVTKKSKLAHWMNENGFVLNLNRVRS